MLAKSCVIIIIVVLALVGAAVAVIVVLGLDDDMQQLVNPTPAPENQPTGAPIPQTLAPAILRPTTLDATLTPVPTLDVLTVQETCNGVLGLCDTPVNQVMFAVPHNAMADAGNFVFPNHDGTLEEALQVGYRGLSLDFGFCNVNGQANTLVLYHAECIQGTRSVRDVFTNILDFVNSNPRETILINAQVDPPVGVDDVFNALSSIPNLLERMHQHINGDSWPTLRELVDENQRIIFFFHRGDRQDSLPPKFHYWFDYAIETEFDLTLREALDPETSCIATRGLGSKRDFCQINEFAGGDFRLPSRSNAQVLNSRINLEMKISECSQRIGVDVNVVLVDFWGTGDLLAVAQEYNEALVIG